VLTAIYAFSSLGQIDKAKNLVNTLPWTVRPAAAAIVARALVKQENDNKAAIALAEDPKNRIPDSLSFYGFSTQDPLLAVIDALAEKGEYKEADDLAAAMKLKHPASYAQALYMIAARLTEKDDPQSLAAAQESIRLLTFLGLMHGVDSVPEQIIQQVENLRKNALVKLVSALARAQRFDEAETLLANIPKDPIISKPQANLRASQVSNELTITSQSNAVNDRAQAIAAIVRSMLASRRNAEADALEQKFQQDVNVDENSRAAVQAARAIGFAQAGNFDSAISLTDRINVNATRSRARAQIAKELAAADKYRMAVTTAKQCYPWDALDAEASILTEYAKTKVRK
jgi:hypothetical protein